MTEEKNISAEIIKGPWRRTINTPTEDQIIKAEQMAFCDEITTTCLMSVLSILLENEMDIGEKTSIKNITFIQESIKSLIFKINDVSHPLDKLIDLTTNCEGDSEKIVSELDENIINDIITSYNAVMEPDNDTS